MLLDVRKALIGSVETLSVALNSTVLTPSHSARLLHKILLLRVLRTVMNGLAVAIIQLFLLLLLLSGGQALLFFYFLVHDRPRRLLFVNDLIYF